MAVINLNRQGQVIDLEGIVITNNAVYELIREMEARYEKEHHRSDNDNRTHSLCAEL